MTRNDNKSITWTSFNKPKSFKTNTDTTTFSYAPDRARYKKTQTGTFYKQTIYIDKTYEHITEQDKTHQKNYIYVNKQLISIHTKTTLITDKPVLKQITQTRYLHYDNLGSIDTITDGKGNIVERMSYTSFGNRRAGDWRANQNNNTTTNYTNELLAKFTNRGYTGHEHIDEMDLIHMNGRVFDPQIGRFLSSDPKIQHPYKTQGYNRYSYVLNNPFKYTDPSGFETEGEYDGDYDAGQASDNQANENDGQNDADMGGGDGGGNSNPYEIREHDVVNGSRGLSYEGSLSVNNYYYSVKIRVKKTNMVFFKYKNQRKTLTEKLAGVLADILSALRPSMHIEPVTNHYHKVDTIQQYEQWYNKETNKESWAKDREESHQAWDMGTPVDSYDYIGSGVYTRDELLFNGIGATK